MAVRLTRSHLEQILTQARTEAPHECCGLLLGRGDAVEEVFPGRNVDETPRTRYVMDPRDQLQAFRLMDERGWDLVGIYHSHPQTAAYPSETDKSRALYPDARYMIVSLMEPEAPHVRAFRLLDGADGAKIVAEEDVVVT
ncbi:MAG TPA: M67 family metallopeptidase [bacterium]|nr:M67 family metallopeptidase [bacterium]